MSTEEIEKLLNELNTLNDEQKDIHKQIIYALLNEQVNINCLANKKGKKFSQMFYNLIYSKQSVFDQMAFISLIFNNNIKIPTDVLLMMHLFVNERENVRNRKTSYNTRNNNLKTMFISMADSIKNYIKIVKFKSTLNKHSNIIETYEKICIVFPHLLNYNVCAYKLFAQKSVLSTNYIKLFIDIKNDDLNKETVKIYVMRCLENRIMIEHDIIHLIAKKHYYEVMKDLMFYGVMIEDCCIMILMDNLYIDEYDKTKEIIKLSKIIPDKKLIDKANTFKNNNAKDHCAFWMKLFMECGYQVSMNEYFELMKHKCDIPFDILTTQKNIKFDKNLYDYFDSINFYPECEFDCVDKNEYTFKKLLCNNNSSPAIIKSFFLKNDLKSSNKYLEIAYANGVSSSIIKFLSDQGCAVNENLRNNLKTKNFNFLVLCQSIDKYEKLLIKHKINIE